MNTTRFASVARRSALAFVLVAVAVAAAAQQSQREYTPQVGQPGKDVIWVPTPEELVDRMLRMAQTTPNDFVVDLGSGDGRTPIAAAKKFGARALGIEYNPDLVELSNRAATKEGVAGKVRFVKADIFESDFSQATVVTMYLLPGLNLKLRPKLLEMKPGTRLASHQFNMDDWEPDEVSNLDGRRAYLWIVPAKVQGNWRLQAGSEGFDLTLEQKYQKLEGSVKLGALSAGLREARLTGDKITFAFVDNAGVRRDFTGRVSGSAMEGRVKTDAGAEAKWTAVKK